MPANARLPRRRLRRPGRRPLEALAALREARGLEAHERWDRPRLLAHQRALLLELVRDAARRSPYYGEALAGIALDDDLDPADLPVLDRATMLDNFDAIVTERRLTLATVEDNLGALEAGTGEELLLGSYRAMASGGTSGRRGVFVYGRDDWRRVLGGLLRLTGSYLGATPRLPRRRVAAVMAESPVHMTARMGRSLDTGLHRMLRLDARAPVAELAETLGRFRPEILSGYASVIALLADEQLAGRLDIEPEVVVTTSEVRTPEMERRIRAAWGSRPFNTYAATETGIIAADCGRHAGLHLMEDLVMVEIVDERGRAVPPGTTGARALVTNLANRTQPLIRLELGDLLTLSPDPCPCGRPFPLLAAIDGRSDDVLSLPGRSGERVAVHPLTLRGPLTGVEELRQYRIVLDHDGLTVEAVLATGLGAEAGHQSATEIARRLRDALRARGVEPPAISVRRVAAIERHPGSGKAKLVESRLGEAP